MGQKQFGPNSNDSGGAVPTGSIANNSSATWDSFATGTANSITLIGGGIKVVAMPGLSGVLATVLSVSGKGALNWLGLQNYDANSRTQRMKVTLDGVVIFDLTSAASAVATGLYPVVGSMSMGGAAQVPTITYESLWFNSSLLIEYASNVTDAGSARIGYRVIPR